MVLEHHGAFPLGLVVVYHETATAERIRRAVGHVQIEPASLPCGFLNPAGFGARLMLYAAYLDGSGKLHDQHSEHIVLAGVVLYEDDISPFAKGWATILHDHSRKAKHRRARYLHMSKEARRCQGEFKGWRPDQVNDLLLDLARFARDNSYKLISAPVDKRRFQELPAPFRKKLCGLSELSFEVFLNGMADDLEAGDSLHIACDDCQDEAKQMYDLLWRYKNRYPARKDQVVSICFADDRFHPALQAADLFAFVAREEEDRRARGVVAEPSALYGSSLAMAACVSSTHGARAVRDSEVRRGYHRIMKAKPEYVEGPEAWARFTDAMRKALAVPHAEIQRRIAERREEAARNPHKRGPKRKRNA